jgi:4'-phosphopantetheinyl transferase
MPSGSGRTVSRTDATRPGSISAVHFAASVAPPHLDSRSHCRKWNSRKQQTGGPTSCRRGALGAWSSTHAIGVDLEEPSKDLEAAELAREYFSKAEARAVEESTGVERLRTFYGFWSLKEAALKAIGEGLPFGLDAFEFDLAQSPRVVRAPPDHGGPEHYRACWIGKLETCIALVTRRPE